MVLQWERFSDCSEEYSLCKKVRPQGGSSVQFYGFCDAGSGGNSLVGKIPVGLS